ncbi:leucine-rich repeat transmembrane neuronal protein 2 [Battus philenor]|uniref:leucine-rich repeat transmembrane neuronal protein 2 n=1 Tax=Battus philenor TaxID=42288 RepID=UPI0035CFC8FE
MTRSHSNLLAFIALLISRVSCKELTELEVLSSQPTRCTYEHAYDMYGAHCAGLRLNKIPSLRGGIEILDFSDNKLQELHADTLSSYSSIKFLYLSENQIYMIDKDAFTSLTYLQTLDLSKNVILELPNSIFQLPSLRKLYLNGNPLLHLSFKDLTITKPIQAPLELLDLSDCKINQLPDWGMLPQLMFYNISHNPLTVLNAQQFSLMCKLAKVDLTESIDNLKLCELKETVIWFQEKRIYFHLSDYTKLNSREFENCPKPAIEALSDNYRQCESAYTQVQNIKTSRRTWLTIGGGLAGFLVGFVLLLYILHRHNVAQTKRTVKEKTSAASGDKNSSAILLDNVS